MIARLLLAVVAILLAAQPILAQSTIDTALPAQGAPFNAAPIRQNFTAAANDINALVRMSAGSTAPSSPVTGRLWLDTSSATIYTLKMYVSGSAAWLPIASMNVSAGIWTPPVGGGTIPSLTSASTVNLGSVPQAAINITGSQSIASFGSSAPEGALKFLVFTGSPQLIYNATFMILPGAANVTVSPGQTAIALSLGSGRWRVGFGDLTDCGLATLSATGCVKPDGVTTTIAGDGTISAVAGGGGIGTVTSVGLSVPAASIFGVTGSPVTTSGTLGLTTTGNSGGIPYFSSGTQLSSSAALTANAFLTGGGAGAAPNAVAITGLVLGNGAAAPSAYTGTSGPANQWITALSAAGVGTFAQPSCASLSDDGAGCTAGVATTGTAGIAKLHNVPVAVGWPAQLDPHNVVLANIDQASTITKIVGVNEVLVGAAATLSVYKAASGVSCADGTILHSGTFNANASLDTNQELTLTATTLAAGDRICLQTTDSANWLAGTGIGTITVFLAPTP